MHPFPKKLTIAEHRSAGISLKQCRVILMPLNCTLPSIYGKTSKAAKQADKTIKAIDHLRNILDCQMFKECPEANTNVYY